MKNVDNSAIHSIRESSNAMRIIASAMIFFFSSSVVGPAAAAITADLNYPTQAKSIEPRSQPKSQRTKGSERQYIEQLHEEIAALQQTVKAGHDLVLKKKRKDKNGKTIVDISIIGAAGEAAIKSHQAMLGQLAQQLMEADFDVQKQFDRDAEHIKANDLSSIIMDRRDKALAEFQKRSRDAQDRLAKLQAETNVASLFDGADAFLKQMRSWEAPKAVADPKHLAFRSIDPKVRIPATNADEMRKLISSQGLHVQGHATTTLRTPDLDSKNRKETINANQLATISADQHDYPLDLGNTMVADLSGGSMAEPGDEYLAASEEVQITPDIQAKAAALHNNPVEIFNWVRNNIQFIPAYGSIQGSQETLQLQRGTPFDVASLLIALLRASSISSRFVYGTVEIPVASVMNWVGGVSSPSAAMNILAQGGIPNIGLSSGGIIKAIRLEHVWVEAWVGAYPSRGSKAGGGKAWLPMDPSFKMYEIPPPTIDLQQQIPFNADNFNSVVQQNISLDPSSNNWISGVDSPAISGAFSDYTNQVLNLAVTQYPTASILDFAGDQKIVQFNEMVLTAGLPYKVKTVGWKSASVLSSMQESFALKMSDSNSTDVIDYQVPTPRIAGKSIAISFAPASTADEAALESYVPKPHADGTPTSPDEFPTSLPSYQIQLVPELIVDGQVIVMGPPMQMGTSLILQKGFISPASNIGTQLRSKTIVVGEYHAIGIDLLGMSKGRIQRLQAKTTAVQAALNARTFEGFSKHDLTGNILQCGILTYFALNDGFDLVLGRGAGMLNYRMPSYGEMQTVMSARLRYGLPYAITFPGMLMDVDGIVNSIEEKAGDSQKKLDHVLSVGIITSLLEHVVPEAMFNVGGASNVKGMSTIRAFANATHGGQKLYQINSGNAQSILPTLSINAGVKSEISDDVNAGLNVYVHESTLNVDGFQGEGFIVLDPLTNSGAFRISGNANGGLVTPDPKSDFGAGLFFTLAVGFGVLAAGAVYVTVMTDGFAGTLPLAGALAVMSYGFSMLGLAYLTGNRDDCLIGANNVLKGLAFLLGLQTWQLISKSSLAWAGKTLSFVKTSVAALSFLGGLENLDAFCGNFR